MNVFAQFTQHIIECVQALDLNTEQALPIERISVEPPRDPSHGDMATNAAMVLAKLVGQKPRDLAEQIAGELGKLDSVHSVEIAGPGFINIRLADSFWHNHLALIAQNGEDYGRGVAISGNTDAPKVNVEYVSANPTGPMHVGHCRGAVVGDALANLLAFAGYDVTKEYYINDAGVQIDVLARSLLHRVKEALGNNVGQVPDGLYPGDYLVPVAEEIAKEYGPAILEKTDDEQLSILRDRAIDAMMLLIREDLATLNVHHDVFFSERSLHALNGNASRIDEMLAAMRDAGHVYEGKLPPPKGEVPEDWEDREQTLFRSTAVGDDMDRPLIKSDGSYTYFAADVAYFKDKFDRGFDRMVFVLGADHGGYVKRLKAVAKAVSGGDAELDVLLCQLVKLYRNGEPVRMSKRAGEFITLRDVVEEVGRDAVRFMMLYRKPEAPLDFDFQKVTEQSRDNPVFYVQYAHARIASVFRQVADELPDLPTDHHSLAHADFAKLDEASEIGLIKKMAEYPRLLEQAAKSDEPHRLAFYLYELASEFHTHWNRGKESPKLRFINRDDRDLTQARLGMVYALGAILRSGLTIIGVDAPEEMR